MRRILPAIVIVVVVSVILVVGLFYMAASLSAANISREMALPILTIVGVVLMLAVLALVAIAFSMLGLTDSTQALALPEGSVRAVIALMLIVLFGILSIYLYSSLAAPDLQRISGLTVEQKELLVSTAPIGSIPIIVPEPGSASDTAKQFTVYLRNNRDPASDDFAKQVLVLLGTLVTSISSFYFGTKAGAAGSMSAAGRPPNPDASASGPRITGITPSVRARDGVPTAFEISGSDLGSATAVKIVSGGDEVSARDIVPAANLVRCNLTVDGTLRPGAWDVVVTDASGKEARLAAALTLS